MNVNWPQPYGQQARAVRTGFQMQYFYIAPVREMPLYLKRWSLQGSRLWILFSTAVYIYMHKWDKTRYSDLIFLETKRLFSHYSCTMSNLKTQLNLLKLSQEMPIPLSLTMCFCFQKMKGVTNAVLQLALCVLVIGFRWISKRVTEERVSPDE